MFVPRSERRGVFINESFSFLDLWYGKRCCMLSKKMLMVAMIISFVRFIGIFLIL